MDTAISRLILDRVSAGEMPPTMRLYVPGREVAFGRRDTVTRQYSDAVAAARKEGFGAVERLAGGRAAVFTEHTIAFSLAVPDNEPQSGIHDRFQTMGELIVAAFARVGVASTIGEVSGEYCPGEFSINHAGRLKLMGVGQRLVRRAAHVGGVIVVQQTALLLRALIPVYRALDIEWRPGTAGSLGDVQPSVTNDDVLAALKAELMSRYETTKNRIPSDLAEEARRLAIGQLPAGGI